MAQTTEFSTKSSLPLPDAFSSGLTELFESARPAIVQVRVEERGGGTGVIWQQNGQVITNNHVVPRDQTRIQVHLVDGRTLDAQVLHRNPRLDLALLKIEGNGFTALNAGDSSRLRVGEWVFAIGHPWGQRWSVTAGIVSTISSVKLANDLTTQYIKSDVRLAPGNSGGPLLNAEGNVVGINAMIFGGDLSVAIPSNVVSDWLANLPGSRNWLGIEIQTVELLVDLRQQTQREKALLVVGIGSRQSYHHDLLVGDILLDVASKAVREPAELRSIIAESKTEGGTIPMRILRGGVIVEIEAGLLTADKAA